MFNRNISEIFRFFAATGQWPPAPGIVVASCSFLAANLQIQFALQLVRVIRQRDSRL